MIRRFSARPAQVLTAEQRETLGMFIGPVSRFFEEVNDAKQNDLDEKVPDHVRGRNSRGSARGC